MKKKILKFLASHQKGEMRVGIRHYLAEGKWLFFLNTPLRFLGGEKFTGVKGLHEIAQEFQRPVTVLSWFRDEYGTSDGAGWEKIGVTISPESTREELEQAAKTMGEKVSSFVAAGPDGMKDLDPVR